VRLHYFLYLFLSLTGCKSIEGEMEEKKVRAEVTQMMHEYHAAIGREGLTAEFAYLDSSENFFWVPPGYRSALTYDSVRTILESNAGTLRSVQFSWDHLQVYPLSNTIASYTGIVRGTLTDTAGQVQHTTIIESGVVVRRKDGWKLQSGQSRLMN
jgi:hypothetical protein